MDLLDAELSRRLGVIQSQGLFRELRRIDSAQGTHIQIDGQTFLNFSSNDYLGLAGHPVLKEAAIQAVRDFGSGSGASRLICGSLAPHHELEQSIARFKGTQAALTFSSGYATAVGTICALLGKDDVIILDKLVHACIVDAARLSGATLRVFAHNDPEDLEDKLKWTAAAPHSPWIARHTLIVTESIFSMDGDAGSLREIVALKEKYGAWLMVDEAHATGVYGKNGSGLVAETGMNGRIEVQMGTLGKALGAGGGYICGSRTLIDFLVNRARSFIFSTAPVPAAAAAATAGIRLVQSDEGEERRKRLRERIEQLNSKLKTQNSRFQGAIVPVLIGDENKAVAAAAALRQQNIFVPAIRYPTVPRGKARLRVTVTSTHSCEDISRLVNALGTLDAEPRNPNQPNA